MFVCPLCKTPLTLEENKYQCENNHCFDKAAQGYCNLLPVHKKASKEPGDNKTMIQSRTCFLNSGAYAPLMEELSALLLKHSKGQSIILDAGCGQGYYSKNIEERMKEKNNHSCLIGIDISKEGIRQAAKGKNDITFFVASLFDLPLASFSVDMIYSVFAPCPFEEFSRVLKPGGLVFCVTPGKRHLFGLKEVLYDEPYENPEKEISPAGFSLLFSKKLSYSITIEKKEEIEGLFAMTPYYYRSPFLGKERLKEKESLSTPVEFIIKGYVAL